MDSWLPTQVPAGQGGPAIAGFSPKSDAKHSPMEAGGLPWSCSIHCGPAFQKTPSSSSCNVKRKGKRSSTAFNSATLLFKTDSTNSRAYDATRDTSRSAASMTTATVGTFKKHIAQY